MPRPRRISYARTTRRAPRRRVATTRRAPIYTRSTRTVARPKPQYRSAPARDLFRGLGRGALALLPYAAAAGGSLLGPAGGVIGGALGTAAKGLVGSIAGLGDYQVNVNTLMSSDPVPEFKSAGPRCTMIKHREFIQDVVGSANAPSVFNISTFPIQPGNSMTFPWLAQIAQNFEQYRFHGLIFEFKTSSGNTSTTPQLGTVILATQYNALAPVFTNKQEMENYEFAGSVVPSQNIIHPIECDPRQTQCNGIFNINTNNNLLGGDKRLYDLGDFSIATIGLPSSAETCGELWVSYDVCLMKPRLNPSSGSVADHYYSPLGTGFTSGSQYFGTDSALTTDSDDFTNLASGTTITFDKSFYGNIQVYMSIQMGATAAPQMPAVAGSNGATAFNILNGNTQNVYNSFFSTTSTVIYFTSYWTIQPLSNSTLPTLTLSGGSFGATPNKIDLVIVQISSDFA